MHDHRTLSRLIAAALKLAGALLGPAMVLAGCATGGPRVVDATACPIPTDRGQNYLISPGDSLEVFVWRNPELSVTVNVRPDGRISTPLIEDIAASGKTPVQLANDMEGVLAQYIRTPEVNIIVGAQGPGNQIRIIGEVVSPQAISYRDGLRVLDVLVAVGGLTDFAAGNRATLSREIGGEQVECEIRAASLVGGDLAQNVPVFPGDVIIVPQTRL